MDSLAKVFKTVRDATVCNEEITTAEKIAVLALVKQELLEDSLREILDDE
jgi:hypothetical protein